MPPSGIIPRSAISASTRGRLAPASVTSCAAWTMASELTTLEGHAPSCPKCGGADGADTLQCDSSEFRFHRLENFLELAIGVRGDLLVFLQKRCFRFLVFELPEIDPHVQRCTLNAGARRERADTYIRNRSWV